MAGDTIFVGRLTGGVCVYYIYTLGIEHIYYFCAAAGITIIHTMVHSSRTTHLCINSSRNQAYLVLFDKE